MKAVYPLHSIEKFTRSTTENGLYVSKLTDHLEKHECVKRPHKHDFYFVFLCVQGKGKQEIDFKTYEVNPGSVYFMTPGQLHRLINCDGGQGYILFHSRDYYEVGFNNRRLRDYPFYFCSHNVPFVRLGKQKQGEIESYFEELLREYNGNEPGRYQKTCSLMELIYISLSREYVRSYRSSQLMPGVPDKLQQFEDLLEKNLTRYKAPADYARLMKTTTRHLNRICQETLGKSTSELITDRIILEAKRNLMDSTRNVAEVAAALGYFDTAYFTRLFRKKTGLTPTAFSKKYSSVMEVV